MGIISLALKSTWHFAEIATSGEMHLNRSRLGKSYQIEEGGTYTVFRQTDSFDGSVGRPVVLVVGFRLKLLASNEFGHKLFQKVCILTTPFWSGFKGFRVKLWLVDHQTKNYLGIYKWAGEEDAKFYARYITQVLKSFSTPGTTWAKIYPTDFELYLSQRETKA